MGASWGWVGSGQAGQKECPRGKEQPHEKCGGHVAAGAHEASRAGGIRDKNGHTVGARKGFILSAEVRSDNFFR